MRQKSADQCLTRKLIHNVKLFKTVQTEFFFLEKRKKIRGNYKKKNQAQQHNIGYDLNFVFFYS